MIEVRETEVGAPDAPMLIRCSEGDAADGVARCIDLAIATGRKRVVVDLGDRPSACSTLLSVLHRAGQRLRAENGRLAVSCSNPGLRRLLDVTLLSQGFTVCASREEAFLLGGR